MNDLRGQILRFRLYIQRYALRVEAEIVRLSTDAFQIVQQGDGVLRPHLRNHKRCLFLHTHLYTSMRVYRKPSQHLRHGKVPSHRPQMIPKKKISSAIPIPSVKNMFAKINAAPPLKFIPTVRGERAMSKSGEK